MFALIEALRKVLDDDLRIVSAFLTKEPGFEMIFSITFDDATTGIARVACNFDTDPDALEWIKRKYTSQAASLNLIAKLVPSAPIARVLHSDLTTSNELGGPYILIQHSHYNLSDDNDESPFYEDDEEECEDDAQLNTPEERELLVKRLAETAANMFRVTLPRIGAVLGVDPISGQPEMGPSLARRYSSSGSSSTSSLCSTPHVVPGAVWKKDMLPADGIQQYISNEIAYHTERYHSQSADPNSTTASLMDIASDVHVPTLLRRVEQLAIEYLVPCYNLDADPSMQRVAIVYPCLGYGNAAGFSIPSSSSCAAASPSGEDEDGTEGGLLGDEQASGLPACLAAAYPTFLRRDGIFANRYTIPSLLRKPCSPAPSSGSGTPTNMDRHRCRDDEEDEEEMEEFEDDDNQANIVVSDEEAQKLRALFEATASKIEPTFINALQRGEKLRQVLEFIQYRAWDQLSRWETDVREELRQMGVCGV